jgi:hypothetical protein
MQSDKRKAPRKPLRYSARVVIEGEENRGCVLTDVSDNGARIEVENSTTLPDKFMLLLAANNGPRRICNVVWRDEGCVGVHFEKRVPATEKASTRKPEIVPTLIPDGPEDAADDKAATKATAKS